jgi:long-chain acyl-CoA synthetase
MRKSSSAPATGASGAPPNLATLILNTAGIMPEKVAFQHKAGKEWRSITYGEWAVRARKLANWMLDRGVQKGDRVGILCYNNPSWAVADLATHMCGAVTVPMYPSITGPQHNYILYDAQVKVLCVMDAAHLAPIAKLPGSLDGISVVGLLAPSAWPPPSKEKMKEAGLTAGPTAWPKDVTVLDDIMAARDPDGKDRTTERIASVNHDDLATICYTSGTTSAPPPDGHRVYAGKGVLLTHGNLISNVEAINAAVDIGTEDVFLSILPLAHMFERTCGYYTGVACGATIAYARSPASFVEDMREVQPTCFACVPMLFERMYQGIAHTIGQAKAVRVAIKGAKKIATFFGAPEDRVAAYLDSKKAKLLGRFMKKATGGRLRFAVSGGAALAQELAQFYHKEAGILILEGYGLTETSPVVCFNRPDKHKFGTVGLPVPAAEFKIEGDGEILVRGPMIMKGYLNQKEETAKVLDKEGFFHTGDIGEFDSDGYLRITGRKKSQFKLSTGKYISPEPIENKMVHELVAQVMVCGENQKVAGAAIFPNMRALRSQAEAHGFKGDDQALCSDEGVRQIFGDLLKTACAHLPDFERVKVFAVLPRTLSVDAGELTPTMKIKRAVVTIKYKDDIEAMFTAAAKARKG